MLWNLNVHYSIRNSPPPVPNLNHRNAVHASPSHFLNIHFNIILPSMPRPSKLPLSLRCPQPNPVRRYPASHTCRICNILKHCCRVRRFCFSPNTQAGLPRIVGRPRLFFQYIRSYPSYLEAVPVFATWERSILMTATQLSWPHFNVETSFSCRADPMHFVQWLFSFLSDVLHTASCLRSAIY